MSHLHTFSICSVCGCGYKNAKRGCNKINNDGAHISCYNNQFKEELKPMIDKEEYQNVIRATYALCQQIYDMELSGALNFANNKLAGMEPYDMGNHIPKHLIEFLEERSLLYALLTAKREYPKTFLEGCRNAPTTPTFRKEYLGTFIPNNPSQT